MLLCCAVSPKDIAYNMYKELKLQLQQVRLERVYKAAGLLQTQCVVTGSMAACASSVPMHAVVLAVC